eukprot:8209847-Pyramimonas_sp.AAC.1
MHALFVGSPIDPDNLREHPERGTFLELKCALVLQVEHVAKHLARSHFQSYIYTRAGPNEQVEYPFHGSIRMVAKTCSARMPSATAKDTHVGTTKRSRTYPVLFKSGLVDIKPISAKSCGIVTSQCRLGINSPR